MRGNAALLERLGELCPCVWCKADAVAFDCLRRDAAPRKIVPPRCSVARNGETVVKEIPCKRIDSPQIVKLAQTHFLTRIPLLCGQRDAELLRLPLDCLEPRDLLDEREELESIATRMAAETVKEPVGRHDGERRGFFVMEGATAPVAVALALQRNISLHDGEDVGLRAHLLHKGLHPRVTHRCLLIYCKLW